MKINELLTESTTEQLDELNIGQAATSVAKGAGKVIGGVAKTAGAIAGIPGGVKRAFQKGKQASTDVIGGTGQGADSAAPTVGQGTANPATGAPQQAGGTAAPAEEPQGFVAGIKKGLGIKSKPAAAGSPQQAGSTQAPAAAAPDNKVEPTMDPAAPTKAADINAQGPKGTAPAKAQTGVAGAALAKTAQATQDASAEKAGQTVYAQVKSQINQLDKKGKQRILQLLQKSIAAPAAQPAAKAPAAATTQAAPAKATPAPKAAPAAANPDAPTSAEQNAADARVAAAGGSPEEVAKQRAAREKKVAARTPRKAAAPSQDEIDASRDRLMGNFTDSIERHKQRMFAEGMVTGKSSIFKK